MALSRLRVPFVYIEFAITDCVLGELGSGEGLCRSPAANSRAVTRSRSPSFYLTSFS
jgi:hypothetical protein